MVWAGPATFTPTAEESTLLTRREVVSRWEGDRVTSAIESTASPAAIFAATLDLEARVGEVSGIDRIVVYDRQATSFAAEWALSTVGLRTEFHVRYRVDPAAMVCSFTLDPTRPSDLRSTEGRFWVEPLASGGARRLLTSRTDSGSFAPAWLVRQMSERNAEQTLAGVRARAERGSSR